VTSPLPPRARHRSSAICQTGFCAGSRSTAGCLQATQMMQVCGPCAGYASIASTKHAQGVAARTPAALMLLISAKRLLTDVCVGSTFRFGLHHSAECWKRYSWHKTILGTHSQQAQLTGDRQKTRPSAHWHTSRHQRSNVCTYAVVAGWRWCPAHVTLCSLRHLPRTGWAQKQGAPPAPGQHSGVCAPGLHPQTLAACPAAADERMAIVPRRI
jgi:hypothetical protein